MYEKMLSGRKILFFRHAPPFTSLDDVSGRDTQPPFPEAPGYQCSVFYYWWAFLRESDAYALCCENGGAGPLASLYSFFGDVRGDDFMRWWRYGGHVRGSETRTYAGRSLFCEAVRPPIKPLRRPIDATAFDDKSVVLRVPISNDLARMTAEFQQLMRPLVEERQREYGEPREAALFPVTSKNPSLKSLHAVLRAHQVNKQHKSAKKYEIAQMLGITAKIAGEKGDADHERSVYTTLARLLTKASVLIRNTERGRFPDHTDYDKTGAIPEPPRALARAAQSQQQEPSHNLADAPLLI